MKTCEVPYGIARRGILEVGIYGASKAERHAVKMQQVGHHDWRVIPAWWGYLPETDTLYWAGNRELALAGWEASAPAKETP